MSLDDVRLNKQTLECEKLLKMSEKETKGIALTGRGHHNHPVYKFYKNNPQFLSYYGLSCCAEFFVRKGKSHPSHKYFNIVWLRYNVNKINDYLQIFEQPKFIPYYMEGSVGQPNYIRTTENVSKLFQDKLVKKWDGDVAKGRPPKWTNRQVPEFYKSREKGE